jgi:uncharacterized protein (TIGR02145 family)
MRTKLTKITLAAGVMLAMAFTLNACSGGDDEGGGGDSSSGKLSSSGKTNSSSSSSLRSSSSIALLKCGNSEYDPSQRFCVDDKLYYKCGMIGGFEYDPLTERCCGNETKYTFVTHFCSEEYIVLSRCNGFEYYSKTQRCQNDVIEQLDREWLCGETMYHSNTQFCESGTTVKDYDFIMDSRDNKRYKITTIGTQTWMAENLNYRGTEPDTIGSCHSNQPANCTMYGRLYSRVEAMACSDHNSCTSTIQAKHRGICPEGWHIPDDDEWDVLAKYVDPNYDPETNNNIVGRKLKAINGWKRSYGDYYLGTDDFGFAALPGDYGCSVSLDTDEGTWWSSSVTEDNRGWYRTMFHDENYLGRSNSIVVCGFSVRCVKD